MSSRYKVLDDSCPHFVTFTVVGWVDVFSRAMYKDLLLESFCYCQQHKGLVIHAWVIMTNHVHMIISSPEQPLYAIVRDLKKFTSKRIFHAIEENELESRRKWMLNLFEYTGRNNDNNKEIQFWKQDYHPVMLDTAGKATQRLHYLHENPVRSGLVWEAWHFKYSSAMDYYKGEKGLLDIVLL